jgi:hypothetical protein
VRTNLQIIIQTSIFQLHASIDDLKEAVNPEILPKEYGGEVPLADMIGELLLLHLGVIFSQLLLHAWYYKSDTKVP